MDLPKHNFIIGPVDTDSISFCKEDMSEFTKEEQRQLIEELNNFSPDFMDWDADGYYPKLLVIKAKNYVLDDGEKIKYRGSSIIDQKKEPALAEMLKEMIDCILNDEKSNLPNIYNKYVMEAMLINDINRWCTKKTITKSVLDAGDDEARLNERKVLDAMHMAIETGVVESYSEGDKLWVYDAIHGEKQQMAKGELLFYKKTGLPKMAPNRILKVKELWNGDQDRLHYVDRVYKTAQILENVIDMDLFPRYTLKSQEKYLKNLTTDVNNDTIIVEGLIVNG